MIKLLLLLIILLANFTNEIFACDSLLYSGGGPSGLEREEASVLQRVVGTCKRKVYYGKGEPLREGSHKTKSSRKDVFYEGLEEHIQSKEHILKIHFSGHGGSTGKYKPQKLEETSLRPDQSTEPKQSPMSQFNLRDMITSEKPRGFIQITNETCLSGNALAKMLGIPLTHPFQSFDYMMYSEDKRDTDTKNGNHPKAEEINRILRQTSHKTACGVASSTGHTASWGSATLGERIEKGRSAETMADIEYRFKSQNHRAPNPAETEFCALRADKHASAPVSSSTIFLESLSHFIGKDLEQSQGGKVRSSGYFISSSYDNFEEAFCEDTIDDPYAAFYSAEEIARKTALQNKRLNLKSNIQYLMNKSEFSKVKSFDDLHKVLEEARKREEEMIRKFDEIQIANTEKLEKERERRIKAVKTTTAKRKEATQKAIFNKYLARLGKLKQTEEFNKVYKDYKLSAAKILTRADCYVENKRPKHLPEIYVGDLLNRIKGRNYGWQTSGDNRLKESCSAQLKDLENKFQKDTKDKTYAEMLIDDDPIDEFVRKVEENGGELPKEKTPTEVLKEMTKQTTQNPIRGGVLSIVESNDKPANPSDYLFGSAKPTIKHMDKLFKETEAKGRKLSKDQKRKIEEINKDIDKRRAKVFRKAYGKINRYADKLRNLQALTSNIRSLMTLDYLERNPTGKRGIIDKFIALQSCEHSGEVKVMSKEMCGDS